MAKEIFSKETERALLGLLVQKPDLMADVTGAVSASDFFISENSSLFEAIEKTFEKHGAADPILLIDQFSLIASMDKETARTFIADLLPDTGIESNISHYIEVIRERRKQRDVRDTLSTTADSIDSAGATVIDIIGDLENKLSSISEDAELKNLADISSLTSEFEIKMKENAKAGNHIGINTGFGRLDDKILGLRGGQFVIVAARPSVGKTAFAIALSKEIAEHKKVGFFSLEMPNEQIILRLLTNISRVDSRSIEKMKFANQSEVQSFEEAVREVKSLNLWLDDSPILGVPELAWKARKLKKEKDLDIIFIDYLQLLNGDPKLINDRQQAVTKISKSLKALARELNIPIVALSQLSRKSEDKGRKPLMSDIRESGSIEQDADIIMFLHRDDYQKTDESVDISGLSEIEVIIAKHRNGSTGSVMMEIDKAHGSLKELGSKRPMKQ